MPFILSRQHLLSRKGLLSRRVHKLACILKPCLVVCFLAGGISYSSGPPIFVYTYISAYCRNRITTSHAPASTTAAHFDYLPREMASGQFVSPSFSAPGFDIAACQTGWLHSRGLSGRRFHGWLDVLLGPAQVARQQTPENCTKKCKTLPERKRSKTRCRT